MSKYLQLPGRNFSTPSHKWWIIMKQISGTSQEMLINVNFGILHSDFIWTSTATLSIKNQLDQLSARAYYLSTAPHKDA